MKLFIQLIILISINEESKLFYWLIIKTWNYFGHWLIGLIQRPKIILVLSMYSFLIGRSCTRRIVIFDHWFLIQWFTNIHLWFLFLFSLANSYLLLSFPSRTHHHSLSFPHQSANTQEIQIHITPIRSSSPPIRMAPSPPWPFLREASSVLLLRPPSPRSLVLRFGDEDESVKGDDVMKKEDTAEVVRRWQRKKTMQWRWW